MSKTATILKEIDALSASYDGSLPWLRFLTSRLPETTRDVWLHAATIHHALDQSDTWPFVTMWTRSQEKIAFVDEIWRYWHTQEDPEDIGQWEITHILQARDTSDSWCVFTRHVMSEDTPTNWAMSFLTRVNGNLTRERAL